jgi:hypothetical protein
MEAESEAVTMLTAGVAAASGNSGSFPLQPLSCLLLHPGHCHGG